ncbi:hypothetical protein AC094_12050 [Bacteroides fragilis]|uniref:Uncharacterized protein n=1 Tax=Bacteroides fragilis TaxID=817 RepID=A0A853PZX2_BACFG|nr:hypothetical protein M075_1219 [Bacteroides fragilis str. 20793-3]OCR34358.1 hypothetical protein AC094_12050 [Bacteroides fragilis]
MFVIEECKDSSFYWSNNQNSKKIEPIRNFDGKLSYLNDD